MILVCSKCAAVNRVPNSKLEDKPDCGKCKQSLLPRHPVELADDTIPTLILFKAGREVSRQSGAMNAQQIAGFAGLS